MRSEQVLPSAFFQRSADVVAPDLLGRYLVREDARGRRIIKIVETEAYLGSSDPASHAWQGRRTARNEALYLPGGSIYVFFVYGMHYCFNVVTGSEDDGDAVLIRAGEPVLGEEMMRRARRLRRQPRPGDIAGGPAKLCQALEIDLELNGVLLGAGGVEITAGEVPAARDVARGPRIGVAYAGEAAGWPLRFALREHPHVSRPRL
jgi:DNA-3-methyladenine glycosylase